MAASAELEIKKKKKKSGLEKKMFDLIQKN